MSTLFAGVRRKQGLSLLNFDWWSQIIYKHIFPVSIYWEIWNVFVCSLELSQLVVDHF